MEKQLKDFIHFYLGQQAEVFWTFEDGRQESDGIGAIVNITEKTRDIHPIGVQKIIRAHSSNLALYYYDYPDVKPLLRLLESITEEEAKIIVGDDANNFFNREKVLYGSKTMRNFSLYFSRALSMGFDIFDLIPAGLALDKTKRLSESKEGGK